jgi:O-antigen/teichoic acid export membrane protein
LTRAAGDTGEGSAARLVRNTIANGLGNFLNVLIGLVLTPFLIRGLGEAGFGVYALALSFSFLGGYVALADLGIEAATARFVAQARSAGRIDDVSAVASNAMACFTGIALVLAPVIALLAFPLVELFGIEGDLRGPAVLCFALVGAQLLFELPARVFMAVIQGAQRFDVTQLLEVARGLSQAALFVAVLVADLGVGAIGGAMATGSLLVLVLGAVAARRITPGLTLARSLVSRAEIRRLLAFSGSLFTIRLTGTIYRQMDRAIVGIALGAATVTFYEIAQRVHLAAQLVQSVSASALLPTAAYLRDHRDTLRDLLLRGTCYSLAASVPVITALFCFAEPVIRGWVGDEYTDVAGSARLFLLYLLLTACLSIGLGIVVALGRTRGVIVRSVVNLLVNAVVSIALVGPLGVDGVILGTLAGQAVTFVPMLRLILRELETPARVWLRGAVLPNAPGLAVQLAVTTPVAVLAAGTGSLPLVLALVLASVAVSVAVFLLVGLDAEHRRLLLLTVRHALGLGGR